MRSKGSASELERRRCLAVLRIAEGYSTEEVADFLGVERRSVQRWVALERRRGWRALAARPCPGRPKTLSHTQEKIVLRWLRDNPMELGFPTELWTAARLAQLIREEWKITIHPRSLRRWLHAHDFSLQKPERIPRERDPDIIADWLATDWLRIKKKRADRERPWC
jgi:transposase